MKGSMLILFFLLLWLQPILSMNEEISDAPLFAENEDWKGFVGSLNEFFSCSETQQPVSAIPPSHQSKYLPKELPALKNAFSCDKCSNTYDLEQTFLLHYQREHGPKIYACDFCDIEPYAVNGDLQQHIRRKHKDKIPRKYAFHTDNSINDDLRNVTVKKEEVCEPLHTTILDSPPLLPPFQVLLDSLPAPKASDIRQLSQIRKQETNHLDDNTVQHLRATRFTCTKCTEAKGFNTKKELTNHDLRKHQTSKPFECNECSERYTTKSSCSLHYTRKHGPKIFACRLCSIEPYALQGDLNQHMRRMHHAT